MFHEKMAVMLGDVEHSIDVYHGVSLPELTTQFWDCYETAFHAGTGGSRDFINHEDFAELLARLDTIVMAARDESGKLMGYLIFTRDNAAILRWGMKDTAYLTAEAKNRNVYWVFLYIPCGRRHYLDGHTNALFCALEEYVRERHGVVAFDQDPETGLAKNIQAIMDQHAKGKWHHDRLETIETIMFRTGP
jgi:hypothetical protein